MGNRIFSVILLPTAACNAACTYCFEHKEPHRLPLALVPRLTRELLDHLEHEGIAECENSKSFQVNTPFPGGPAKEFEAEFDLDKTALAGFLVGLFDLWMERGRSSGVSLGPFDALIDHFTRGPARLPCIWKENCSNQFISVNSKGTVAQCDCWVTSYPETSFGNVFQEPGLTQMLRASPARRGFVERPRHLVENDDCLECRFLSICHGGCPVRAYSALGTMLAKDPYCEVYQAVFERAERYGRELLGQRISH